MTSPNFTTPILLVDDIEENLIALVALLRHPSRELHTARSGREALELLLRNDYALALLDVRMPEIDGFELAEMMRGNPRTRSVPIIFLTADSREPQRLFRGYEAGAVDFLFKPIEPRVLARKVSTFLELFEQKQQLRDQLRDLERVTGELTESLRMSETFVAALGHDLRSPLAAVSFGLAMLERQVTDPASQRAVARMRSASGRMAAIIDQLYDVARVRLGEGLVLDRVTMDAVEATREVVREHQTAHPDLHIGLTAEGDGQGSWDRVRLARAVANLVGNAVQHGERDGGIEVRVDGTAPTLLRIEVWNRGVVPESARPHLFEPFRRGKSSNIKGLGLGLYIVQQIAAAHGGRIVFDSSARAGTRFTLELPRTAAIA